MNPENLLYYSSLTKVCVFFFFKPIGLGHQLIIQKGISWRTEEF